MTINLWVIFITGLTIGGLTCLAVQGGLLASVITAANRNEKDKTFDDKNAFYMTIIFLLAKLLSYSTLGFLLGFFGEKISINQNFQIVMQIIAGLYMIAVALNLFDIHPIFRYVVIKPPKFLTRNIKNISKSNNFFAPAFLGIMTIFIPCGTTLAMEALAISSRNPLSGSAILTTFVLGTTPLFFSIGWLTNILSDKFKDKFLKFAAVCVIYLGLTSVYGGMVASGFPISIQSLTNNINNNSNSNNTDKLYGQSPSPQNIEIEITSNGYNPKYIKVKNGIPVTITLVGKDAYSCATAFRIPKLGISKNLEPNETYKFSFTPKNTGKITYTCSMGMYSGVIEVI